MFGPMSTPLPRRSCWHVSRLGLGWRIEVVHVSSGVVRERVRGRRRRGRVTLDPTSSPCVRARRVKFGPCTVSGAREIEDFEKTRIMSTRKRDQDPWHRDFQSCREGAGGGVFFDGQTCPDVLQDGRGRRTEARGNPGHGNGIGRRDGKENWMEVLVESGGDN